MACPHLGRDFIDAFQSSGLVESDLTSGGNGIGVYLTEGSCPDPGWISNYVRINGTSSAHSKFTTSILRAAAPFAKIHCGLESPYISGFAVPAGVYILTSSASLKNSNNNYRTEDRDWDNFVYNTGVAAFNSGSNTGSLPDCNGTTIDCHQIGTPGKGLNVLHVGNSHNSNPPDIVYPNSPWKNPNIRGEKPDFVVNGGDFRPYCILSDCKEYKNYGTSGATPHAAGFAASLMSTVTALKLRPEYLRAAILVGAVGPVSNNNCPQYYQLHSGDCNAGSGAIRISGSLFGMGRNWRSSSNAGFLSFDSQQHGDPIPGNGKIDWNIYLIGDRTKARIVLTWLTRGSYTYGHTSDVYPIGTDLDFLVYDPNGAEVAVSASYDNSFEIVEFDPNVTGNYRVSINRFRNRDTGAGTYIAV